MKTCFPGRSVGAWVMAGRSVATWRDGEKAALTGRALRTVSRLAAPSGAPPTCSRRATASASSSQHECGLRARARSRRSGRAQPDR